MSEKSGFEELMSQVDGFLFHPLTLGFTGFAVFCALLVFAMNNAKTGKSNPLKFSDTVWLNYVYWFAILFAPILVIIFVSILAMLKKVGVQILTEDTTGIWGQDNMRWYVLSFVGLLTALGGIIGTPLALIRVHTTERQTITGEKQSKLAADALFNGIMKVATDDLNASYQTTIDNFDGSLADVWKDDILRRIDAISRLEKLAEDYVEEAPRIVQILCVYVKELTRDYPAETPSEDAKPSQLKKWARELTVKRSDMEYAVQALGRIHTKTSLAPQTLRMDLSGANLQAMNLNLSHYSHASFSGSALDGATMVFAKAPHANFDSASLVGVETFQTNLSYCNFDDANLSSILGNQANFQNASFFKTDLTAATFATANFRKAEFSGAKLDYTNLYSADFKDAYITSSSLSGAQITHTMFDSTNLENVLHSGDAHGTYPATVFTQVQTLLVKPFCAFRSIRLSSSQISNEILNDCFADGSVILSESLIRPSTWPEHVLTNAEFDKEWKRFKKDPGAYVPPQLRKE
jgi:uncharacterized protein YjbI with pentapeptide repeats